MSKNNKFILLIVLTLAICGISYYYYSNYNVELKTVRSERELMRLSNNADTTAEDLIKTVITLPFRFSFPHRYRGMVYDYSSKGGIALTDAMNTQAVETPSSSVTGQQSSKDYSKTNIQVENVDEADITKTDGDYIYSLSENNVIITDVKEPKDIKIATKIEFDDGSIPQDLILYKDELVVISSKNASGTSRFYYSYNDNTSVRVYDITNREKPSLLKSYELYEPYYTSRCINNMLYVISSGYLREEDDKIVRDYYEDHSEKEIPLNKIKYLKDVDTRVQTLISVVDLNNAKADINVSSYLIDISNAYVSENSIYLLNAHYDYNNVPPISSIFGWKGIIGAFTYEDDNDLSYGQKTEIFKFDINSDGNVSYKAKNKFKGRTINQYSLDELNGHLRVAMYDYDGTRVLILDEKLNEIGKSDNVAKGETMYSSRFMGDRVYLVTYRTMDPLFVIDLSQETKPKVLGELHIPGYSTYLHPYDADHLIGIGMQTEEIVNRSSTGRVLSTTARIIGMKMALFDVSDVNNPTQISETIIGDRSTSSAILTNPKALLFSKEKQLIAIPVNNYNEDFEINASTDTYESLVNSYRNYNSTRKAEGYFVYNINLEDGFKLKGVITHETDQKQKGSPYWYYYNTSRLLRGMYIDENLYTVSETAVKVNDLATLSLVNELKIK